MAGSSPAVHWRQPSLGDSDRARPLLHPPPQRRARQASDGQGGAGSGHVRRSGRDGQAAGGWQGEGGGEVGVRRKKGEAAGGWASWWGTARAKRMVSATGSREHSSHSLGRRAEPSPAFPPPSRPHDPAPVALHQAQPPGFQAGHRAAVHGARDEGGGGAAGGGPVQRAGPHRQGHRGRRLRGALVGPAALLSAPRRGRPWHGRPPPLDCSVGAARAGLCIAPMDTQAHNNSCAGRLIDGVHPPASGHGCAGRVHGAEQPHRQVWHLHPRQRGQGKCTLLLGGCGLQAAGSCRMAAGSPPLRHLIF